MFLYLNVCPIASPKVSPVNYSRIKHQLKYNYGQAKFAGLKNEKIKIRLHLFSYDLIIRQLILIILLFQDIRVR